MRELKQVNENEININPFEKVGKQWMLITAAKDGKVNTMTASWGGLGVMWNENTVSVVIRQTRYTKEMVDGADYFSVSFLDHDKYAKELGYLGKVSGRDEDKISKMNLHVEYDNEVPYIGEAEDVIICKKMFRQTMTPDSFIREDIDEKWYADKNYHDLYIGGIVKMLSR